MRVVRSVALYAISHRLAVESESTTPSGGLAANGWVRLLYDHVPDEMLGHALLHGLDESNQVPWSLPAGFTDLDRETPVTRALGLTSHPALLRAGTVRLGVTRNGERLTFRPTRADRAGGHGGFVPLPGAVLRFLSADAEPEQVGATARAALADCE